MNYYYYYYYLVSNMSRRARSPEVGVETNLGLSNMKPNAKSEAKPKLKPKPKTRKTTEIDLEVETVDLGTGATDLIETGIETDIETDIQTETDLGPSKKKRKTVTPETKSTGVDLFNSQQSLAIQEIVAGTIAKLAPTLSQLPCQALGIAGSVCFIDQAEISFQALQDGDVRAQKSFLFLEDGLKGTPPPGQLQLCGDPLACHVTGCKIIHERLQMPVG